MHENQHARLLSFVEACELTSVYRGRKGVGTHSAACPPPTTAAAVSVGLGRVTYHKTNKYGLNRHEGMTSTIHADTNKA